MNLERRRVRTAIQFCVAQWFMLFGVLSGARAADDPLKLVRYTPMTMDGTATTVSTTLLIYNPNTTSVSYSLSVDNAIARNMRQPVDWGTVFYGTDNKPGGQILEGKLPSHESIAIRVDISQAIEAGETDAELRSFGKKIGDLKVLKERNLPFKVSLEGNPAEKPEIELVEGVPLNLRLKNDDPMVYPVRWELTFKGVSVVGPVGQSEPTQLGPNGTTPITVNPDSQWFSLYQSFFRSEQVDGTLRISYAPGGSLGGYPSKTIPIKAKLGYLTGSHRDLSGMIAILLILIAGGFTSVYVNVDLVNRIRTMSAKKRLDQLAKAIGEIQPQLNSQLRVSLWLERGRIASTFPSGVLFTPDAGAVLTQADADMDALKIRVDWASKIRDTSLGLTRAITNGEIPPTLFEQGSKDLDAAQDLLKKSVLSADEVQRIQFLVGDAINLVNGLGDTNAALDSKIADRLTNLSGMFTVAVLNDPICVQIKAQVPGPFGFLPPASQPASQAERDENTRKLIVIAGLVQLQKADVEIIGFLQRQGCFPLSMAEQLLKELKEGVSFADLSGEITAVPPRVYVKFDRDTIRVNTPLMMKLTFNKQLYDRAAAKRRLVCEWSFDHDGLTEVGSEVHHYFPLARKYDVAVTFSDQDTNPITAGTPVVYPITVAPQRVDSRAQLAVELQRWAAGFFVAVVGLFIGAKDKIVSLDTLAAIFVIFLLGFSIDMAKNYLVAK